MREKISSLKNITEDDGKRPFEAVVLLKSAQTRTAKNNSEYLTVDFCDNTGTLSTMCFGGTSAFAALSNASVGSALEIRGVIEFYQGRLSPKIESVRKIEGAELSSIVESLAPVSPYDPVQMRKELFSIIETIADEALRKTVLLAIEETGEAFFTSTAAVKMHHAYVYGLLEHTLKMSRAAAALAPLYPYVDRDLAVAGCVLHDIGKVEEYTQGLVPDRTRTGLLHGHVVLGYKTVRRAGIKSGLNADILERLEHIILSHQGELEWGAAVRAATPEAVFVSSVDFLDARMGAVEAVLDSGLDAEFAEVPALKAKVLTKKPIH